MGEVSDTVKQVAQSKTVEKAYDDALAPLFRQIGCFGADLAKTARLILAPLQVTASLQDRLEVSLKKLESVMHFAEMNLYKNSHFRHQAWDEHQATQLPQRCE